jgi:hypothetical protein
MSMKMSPGFTGWKNMTWIYLWSTIYSYVFFLWYLIYQKYINYSYILLVGGIPYTYLPLCKMMEWNSVGMMKFPTEWKNKIYVPNHQPVTFIVSISPMKKCKPYQFSPSGTPFFPVDLGS